MRSGLRGADGFCQRGGRVVGEAVAVPARQEEHVAGAQRQRRAVLADQPARPLQDHLEPGARGGREALTPGAVPLHPGRTGLAGPHDGHHVAEYIHALTVPVGPAEEDSRA